MSCRIRCPQPSLIPNARVQQWGYVKNLRRAQLLDMTITYDGIENNVQLKVRATNDYSRSEQEKNSFNISLKYDSPFILRGREHFKIEDYEYFVYEYDYDLATYFNRGGCYKSKEFKGILQDYIRGLDYVHSRRGCHGNISLTSLVIRNGREFLADLISMDDSNDGNVQELAIEDRKKFSKFIHGLGKDCPGDLSEFLLAIESGLPFKNAWNHPYFLSDHQKMLYFTVAWREICLLEEASYQVIVSKLTDEQKSWKSKVTHRVDQRIRKVYERNHFEDHEIGFLSFARHCYEHAEQTEDLPKHFSFLQSQLSAIFPKFLTFLHFVLCSEGIYIFEPNLEILQQEVGNFC